MSEAEIGIEGYLSSSCGGTGGRLKTFPEDFVVEEIPEDFYAAEELELGRLSKCKSLGRKRKRKTVDKVLEDSGQER
jgi:tRNA(Glu) U13 pseudouridine synthase TruD